MSKETIEWLNQNTLIGFTDKRGTAWHHRAGADNHYAGAVPVADVERRLFDWEAEEKDVFVHSSGGAGEMQIPGRKAIVRSDNGHVMGIFTSGYKPHQYREWLLSNVASILDDDLSIGSAGLLKGGAVAWVSVEVPETITTPEGVQFRPGLMARTSFDGSLSTTYGRHITNVVCDNTMGAAAGEHGGQVFKVKHSSRSLGRLSDARNALGIVYETADEFQAEVKRLCETPVDDRAWDRVLNTLVPMPDHRGPRTRELTTGEKRAFSMAEGKRDTLRRLYRTDARVAPWSGTAFGVWQAFNTYGQHEAIVRTSRSSRQERNMLRDVEGKTVAEDAEIMSKVMALV